MGGVERYRRDNIIFNRERTGSAQIEDARIVDHGAEIEHAACQGQTMDGTILIAIIRQNRTLTDCNVEAFSHGRICAALKSKERICKREVATGCKLR